MGGLDVLYIMAWVVCLLMGMGGMGAEMVK
jgi:hypothetical protein